MKNFICSRCGCDITDDMIEIDTRYKIYKIDGEFAEEYNDVSDITREFLCRECFNNYVEALDILNKSYCGNFLSNTTDIINGVTEEDGKRDN